MADTIGPQVPPAPGRLWASDKRRQDRERRQLQQQRVIIPPSGSGGGAVGGAFVYTSDTVGIQWPSGATDLSFGSASYTVESAWGAGVPLSVAFGNIAVVQPGLYQAWCYVDLEWASEAEAPGSSLSVHLNGNGTAPGRVYLPIIHAGLRWGVIQPVTYGPEWMNAGDYWRLEADGGAASSADIARSAASWRITRFL